MRRKASRKDRAERLLSFIREDMRPEVYDLPPTTKNVKCWQCEKEGHVLRFHDYPNAYITSPVNTPGGQSAFICREHLPDNAVIFNPYTNKCRDKKGENEWTEK